MTQHEVAMRMWTTKSAVSRLESGRYARPTLDTVEKYALAVGARRDSRAPGLVGPFRPRADDVAGELPVEAARSQSFSRFWPVKTKCATPHRMTRI
jgi:transcriptional regulator with XRE-family HTH domain